jgi:hypothetical protein
VGYDFRFHFGAEAAAGVRLDEVAEQGTQHGLIAVAGKIDMGEVIHALQDA